MRKEGISMKTYQKLEMQVVLFQENDVLTVSNELMDMDIGEFENLFQ